MSRNNTETADNPLNENSGLVLTWESKREEGDFLKNDKTVRTNTHSKLA